MKKVSYSNIAVALIFFVVGAGIGTIIGFYNGYNLGYAGGRHDNNILTDTVEVFRNTNKFIEYE